MSLHVITPHYVVKGGFNLVSLETKMLYSLNTVELAQPGAEGAVRCFLAFQRDSFKLYRCGYGLVPGSFVNPWSQLQEFKADHTLSEEIWVLPPEEGTWSYYDWKGVSLVEAPSFYRDLEGNLFKGAKVVTDDGDPGRVYRSKSHPWRMWIYERNGPNYFFKGTFGWPLKEGDKLFFNKAYGAFSHVPMDLEFVTASADFKLSYQITEF